MFDCHWFFEYLDPLAGAVVGCMIFKVAYGILKNSIKGLMDLYSDNQNLKPVKDLGD
jgi:divalent metal cation (Fe/Co/Zn/Cd) transporter